MQDCLTTTKTIYSISTHNDCFALLFTSHNDYLFTYLFAWILECLLKVVANLLTDLFNSFLLRLVYA